MVEALGEGIRQLAPDVLVVSGDLTQRARSRQFEEAAEFLARFSCPKVVVPGNHDIPLYNVFARFTQPFTKYARFIDPNLEPVFEDDEVLIAGLTTAQPFRWAGGFLQASALPRVLPRLERVKGKLKVIVTHHPLDLFNDETGRRLLGAGPDLLLAGHLHASSARATVKLNPVAHRSAIVVQAGTSSSTRLREERNAFNLIETSPGQVSVLRYTASETGQQFLTAEPAIFTLGPQGWYPAASAH